MKEKWRNYLFIVTLLFFTLGFFNIVFALLGFLCLILPFIFLVKDKKKTWCQHYCPRADLFTVLTKGRSVSGKTGPDWLTKGRGKWFVLAYFVVNLFIITMSTIRVSKGLMDPVEQIRFLIAFPLPWNLPQILDFGQISGWVIHLSYRIYSMMFTTTVIGLVLGWLFRPRTWCQICPINTLSDLSLKNKNVDNNQTTEISEVN